MTGIEFLKAVRAHDVEVPVILMTGEPGLESAIRAVEYGAFRYLAKPVASEELWETVLRAARLHKMARLKREALELPGADGPRLGERAALEVRFSWGMSLLWTAFQPIVGWREQRVVGFEALLRSDEPLMKNPADILDAAERLGRLHELGRAVRAFVAAAAAPEPRRGSMLFVNLHSADLNDEELYSARCAALEDRGSGRPGSDGARIALRSEERRCLRREAEGTRVSRSPSTTWAPATRGSRASPTSNPRSPSSTCPSSRGSMQTHGARASSVR